MKDGKHGYVWDNHHGILQFKMPVIEKTAFPSKVSRKLLCSVNTNICGEFFFLMYKHKLCMDSSRILCVNEVCGLVKIVHSLQY